MIRNRSGQAIGAQMVNATTGAAFIGAVTVYVTGDNGTQAIGTVGAGLCTHEGNGYYSYGPSQAETNFAHVAFTFIGTGAIPVTKEGDTFTEAQSSALGSASGASALTVRELLVMCLRRIGVAPQGVTPQPETMMQALQAFNAFVDAMSANRLMLYGETRTTFPITSGTQTYNVGSGQVVNRVRPVYVEPLGGVSPIRLIDSSSLTPVEIPLSFLSDQQWRAVSMKTMTSPRPTCARYEPTFPNSTITLWPVPTATGLQGVLYAPTGLVEFAMNDFISLPPGYRRFLVTNVAMELCPEFERAVPAGLAPLAAQAKADVERVNMRLTDMATDPMWSINGGGTYNIYSDSSSR